MRLKLPLPFIRRSAGGAERRSSNKSLERAAHEARLQRLAIAGGVLAVALVVGIPAFGYYREVVARGQEETARVNDVPFRMDEYIAILRYRQRQIDSQLQLLQQFGGQGAQQVAQQRAVIPTSIVFEWVDDEIIRQQAARRGIVVTPEEVDQQLRRDLEPPAPTTEAPSSDDPASPAPTPTPTAPPAPFEERYRNLLAFTGLTDAQYREIVRTRMLRERLEQQLQAQTPTIAEQMRARGILVQTESEANDLLNRIQNGEDFGSVAFASSLDSRSRENNGDLGWLPRGSRGDELFDRALFSLQGTVITGPVQGGFGYWILQRIEGPEVRELSPEQLEQLRNGALSRFLEEQKRDPNNRVIYAITSDRQLWAQQRIDRERQRLASQARRS
ncbi:MAG: peptidylprolyl isomerase [Dehalococcoidia bacterium]|nr:peptidylprolyl isomerase [Dehalococcoidia bacterium]